MRKSKIIPLNMSVTLTGGENDGRHLDLVEYGKDYFWLELESQKRYRQVFVPADSVPTGTQFLSAEQVRFK